MEMFTNTINQIFNIFFFISGISGLNIRFSGRMKQPFFIFVFIINVKELWLICYSLFLKLQESKFFIKSRIELEFSLDKIKQEICFE